MTLEEFAHQNLSTRAKNVVLSLTKDELSFYRDRIWITVRPKPDAHIFDVFKLVTFESLTKLPNCGIKTAIEIEKALKGEGILHLRRRTHETN